MVFFRAVVGQELEELPSRGDVEEVCRAGVVTVVVVVVPPCSGNGGGAAYRDTAAEPVALRAVVGQELE